jgi:hypothetical protein
VLIEGGFDYENDILYPVSGLQGNLIRLPTLGVSFGLSSIAELQLDGGIYQHLSVTSRRPAPLSNMLDFTGDSTHDVEDIVVGTKVRVVAEGPGHPSFGLRFATRLPISISPVWSAKPPNPSASSATSASAFLAIRPVAIDRTTCSSTARRSRGPSSRGSRS